MKKATFQIRQKLRDQALCYCGQPLPENESHREEHSTSEWYECCDCFDGGFGLSERQRNKPRLYEEEDDEVVKARKAKQDDHRAATLRAVERRRQRRP